MNFRILVVVLVFVIFQPAHALKLGFLKNSIVNELSDSDLNDLKRSINQSLDTLQDRQVLEWSNEDNTVEGRLKVMFSYSMGKTICKRARLYLTSKGKKEPWQMNVCKQDSRWQIMETPLTLLSDPEWKDLQITLASLLSDAPLGESVFWESESSKVGGTLAIIKERKVTERQCRTALISLKADDNKMLNGQYEFCRKPGADKWSRHVTGG